MPLTVPRRAAGALVPFAAAAFLAFPSAPAGATDAAKPSACAGLLQIDPAGDQAFDATSTGLGDPAKTADNTDITGLFMNYRPGKDGKPVLTANIQIANLDETLPSPSDSQGGVWYYVFYRLDDGVVHFVRAANRPGTGIEYAYGSIQVLDGLFSVYNTDGQTTGAFFEGPDGVVQIDVPEAAGGKPGTQLGGVIATVDYIQGYDDFFGLNNHVDEAPDGADVSDPAGETYTVADCPATEAAVTPPPAPAAPVDAGAPSGSSASSDSSTPATTALPFRASPTIGSARRAAKDRTLAFRVQATQAIANLRVQLRAANGRGPVLAGGTLKSLSGARTLKLRLARRLKKGRYALIATGTVDGRALRTVQQVRITG